MNFVTDDDYCSCFEVTGSFDRNCTVTEYTLLHGIQFAAASHVNLKLEQSASNVER